MNTIAFVVPYYGSLPSSFPLWLQSVEYNNDIDFLLFSNQDAPQNLPQNVKWQVLSFDDLKARIDKTVGFRTKVETAYKLCDVRPCYGDIFQEELKGYDFWGFCDIDLIFGNIRNFLTEEVLEQYDKIGSLGHCIVIRNTEKMRTMYKQKIGKEEPYKTVLSCKENMSFDEGGSGDYGFPSICREHEVREFWKRWFTDIYTQTFEFRHKQYHGDTAYYREISTIEIIDGDVRITNKDDKSTFSTMYVHFQGRKMNNLVSIPRGGYYAIANCFTTNRNKVTQLKDIVTWNANKKQRKRKAILKKMHLLFFFIIKGKIFDRRWRKYVF